MKINKRSVATVVTHEGAPARRIGALAELRRSVGACLLWEDQFYEDGKAIADRIAELVKQCSVADVISLAIEARSQFNLRHAPLMLMREVVRHKDIAPEVFSKNLPKVIQRADELAEFVALYWKDGKQPLTKQVKRGLAWSLHKFNEYELAKYSRDYAVKLRDVMFLARPKPRNEAEAALWKRLANKELVTPDTWEVELSAGKDKREVFERLIREGKLGYMALLRNLRNMVQASCDRTLVEDAIRARKGAHRVLPYRFIAAAKHAPQFEPALDAAMQASMEELDRLPGHTLVLVDNSGSMNGPLSAKSDLYRTDAAAGLAIQIRGIAGSCQVFSFADGVTEVPARSGMALRDAIRKTPTGGTYLGRAVTAMSKIPHDRLIVITDEQSHDPVPNPSGKGYMINVASYKNGVGYSPWVHVEGFSESVVRFIAEYERTAAA